MAVQLSAVFDGLVGATDCIIVPVGPERAILRDRIAHRTFEIDGLAAAVLLATQQFLPIAEHRKALMRTLPDQNRLFDKLDELLRNRLLLRGTHIIECAQQYRSTFSPRQISSLAIVTADRPVALRNCLDGYMKTLEQLGRTCRILVLDDSRSESSERATQAAVKNCERGGTIYYLGSSERRTFSRRLCAKGLDRDLVSLALHGFDSEQCTTGANRNFALLKTVGELMLCSDDDVDPQLNWTEGGANPVRVCDHGDLALETRFFPTRQAVLKELTTGPVDFLGAHERLLGATAAEIAARLPDETCLVGAPSRFASDVLRSRGGVRITLTGVAGDSGMPTGALFLRACGGTRDRFLSTEDRYRQNRRGREIVRHVNRPTIAQAASVMTTTMTGMDNRTVTPPFLPSFRSQDELFGRTLARLHQDMYYGYTPLALMHAAEMGRVYGPLRTRRTVAQILGGVMNLISMPPGASDASQCFRTLGQGIAFYGSLPPAEFAEAVWALVTEQVNELIVMYEDLLTRYHGEPEYWADEVRTHIEALAADAAKPDFIVPQEFAGQPSQGLKCLRRVVGLFGRLLSEWPDIVAASRSLADDDS